MHKLLLSAGLVFAASCAAHATNLPPTSNTPITPNGAAVSYSLGTLTGATNWNLRTSHVAGWKPFGEGQTADSAGTYNGKTLIYTFEVPFPVTGAKLVLGNSASTGYTITGASIAGSSEWAVPGYTGNWAGMTPYDASGAALTTNTTFTWGNNGVDSSFDNTFPQTAPANTTSGTLAATASTASTSLTFNTGGFVCPQLYSRATVISSTLTTQPPLWSNTYVSACNAGTGAVTLTKFPHANIPSGTTVYFLPANFSVPAAPNNPLTAQYFSDPAPLLTPPRLDGPAVAGMTIIPASAVTTSGGAITGITPLSGTVASTTLTGATMSSNLAADIPAGTSMYACSSGALSAAMTPAYTLTFASTTGVVAGMYVNTTSAANFSQTQPAPYDWPVNTVASVTGTTVTLTNPLPLHVSGAGFGSGTTYYFTSPVATTAPLASGVSTPTLTVASTASLSVGMNLWNSGSPLITGTISSITDSTHVVMSGTTQTAIPSGTTVVFQMSLNSSATSTAAVQTWTSAAVQNTLDGMTALAVGLPANDYVVSTSVNTTSNSFNYVLYSPTSTIASGTTVYFCNKFTTTADSPPGQPVINLPNQWQNYLVTVRMDVSSTFTNYWSEPQDTTAITYNWPGQVAPSRYRSYQCTTPGGGGAPVVGAIGNSVAGTCNYAFPFPYALVLYSPQRVLTIGTVGDSHFAGDTTTGAGFGNFAMRAALLMSNPGTTPVVAMNTGRGGQPSEVYYNEAVPLIQSVHPGFAFIQQTTPNDDGSDANAPWIMQDSAQTLAQMVDRFGGLPILAADYQRQVYGGTLESATGQAFRLAAETALNTAAPTGTVKIDLPALCYDPVNGQLWHNPLGTVDGVHWDDYCHSIAGTAAAALMNGYLRR